MVSSREGGLSLSLQCSPGPVSYCMTACCTGSFSYPWFVVLLGNEIVDSIELSLVHTNRMAYIAKIQHCYLFRCHMLQVRMVQESYQWLSYFLCLYLHRPGLKDNMRNLSWKKGKEYVAQILNDVFLIFFFPSEIWLQQKCFSNAKLWTVILLYRNVIKRQLSIYST